MQKSTIFLVACLLLFSFFSFLIFRTIPDIDNHFEVDSDEYIEVVQEYQRTQIFKHPTNGMPAHTHGYYWFVAIIQTLCGNSLTSLFLVQYAVSLLCIVLMFYLALLLWGPFAACCVGLLMACNIGLMVYTQLIMAEVLLLLFLIGYVFSFFVYIHNKKLSYLFLSLFLLSLSVIIKPVALFYGPIALCFGIWNCYKTFLRKLLIGVSGGLFFYIPLLCYMTYNFYHYDLFVITPIPAVNLYDYFLPRRILSQLNDQEQADAYAYIKEHDKAQEQRERSKELFWHLFLNRPFLFIKAIMQGMTKIVFGLYSTQLKVLYNTTMRGGACSYFLVEGSSFFNRLYAYAWMGATHSLIAWIACGEVLWLFLQFLLVMLACIFLIQERNYFVCFYALSYLGYFDFAACFDGCGRYRIMLEPMVLLLVSYSVHKIWHLKKNSFAKAVIAAA